jgi:hypothetical protein
LTDRNLSEDFPYIHKLLTLQEARKGEDIGEISSLDLFGVKNEF